MAQEGNEWSEHKVWVFDKFTGHRLKVRLEVEVDWSDGPKTWEPLSAMALQDPVTCAKYAKDNDLLEIPGWKRFKSYVKREKKFIRMLRQAALCKVRQRKEGTVYKFGVRVPRNYREAIALDGLNGNTLWRDAIKKEMGQLMEYKTFKARRDLKKPPSGYQFVKFHLVFDVKHDLRRKARMVAGGHMTKATHDDAFSSVVSLKGMRFCIFIAELNALDILAGDIGNAYLEALTREKIYFIIN